MKKHEGGITMIEAVVTVAILATAFLLTTVISRAFVSLQKQGVSAKIHQEVQPQIYDIVQEIRNSRYIAFVDSTTLTLSVYNYKNGADVLTNPNLFLNVNIGTVTFYSATSGQDTFLIRSSTFNNVNTTTHLFKNQLATVDNINYIFENRSASPMCPCDRVGIAFRFNKGFFKDDPKVYESEAVVRSFVGN